MGTVKKYKLVMTSFLGETLPNPVVKKVVDQPFEAMEYLKSTNVDVEFFKNEKGPILWYANCGVRDLDEWESHSYYYLEEYVEKS